MSYLTPRSLTSAALFAGLAATGALVSIPVGTVPFTLQVIVVLLAGLLLGPWLGAASMFVYLLLGLVAPVYAGGTSGLGVLFGPTGGYLFGFVVAAAAVGLMRDRLSAPGLLTLVGLGLVGLVPIYAIGSLWLALQLHVGVGAALSTGVAPFVVFDMSKALIAGMVARGMATLPLGLPATLRHR